jgi:hypothetical protein
MAGACLTGIKSINVEANKKNKTILFTTTLPRELPREFIESQVGENVSGNCLPDVFRINQLTIAASADLSLNKRYISLESQERGEKA